MTKGSGDARMQPLYFLITTAGTDTIPSAMSSIKKHWISCAAKSMTQPFIP
nr:hypothetical protein [Atopobium minutum]